MDFCFYTFYKATAFMTVYFLAHPISTEKVAALKGNNLLPLGANAFLLE